MIAGEAKDPRHTIPRAFRTIMARLLISFVGGGLCVGVSSTFTSDEFLVLVLTCRDRSWFRQTMRRTCVEHCVYAEASGTNMCATDFLLAPTLMPDRHPSM